MTAVAGRPGDASGGAPPDLRVLEPRHPLRLYDRLPGAYQAGAPDIDAGSASSAVSLLATASASMLGEGTTGTAVDALQRALAWSRHDPGPADGSFGPRTQDAVRAFQRQRGLVVDGLVGPQTAAELAAPLLRRFLDGLDDVLRPILDALDNAHGYVDIGTAPPHFLEWLSWLVTAPPTRGDDEHRRRAAIRAAAELDRYRGTKRGLVVAAALAAGVPVESVRVTEEGDSAWDPDPGAEPPGRFEPRVLVEVRAPGSAVDAEEAERLRSALQRDVPVGLEVELRVVPDAAG